MQKEVLYIAGPECFYENGNEQLNAMRRLAESKGCAVSLPNDRPLQLDHADLRKNADTIFQNCADSMNASTAILCDLEFYRGPEADGGSIYEIGMAYARGIRCYGYTRDKRDMKWKYQGLRLEDGVPYDRKGRILPYWDLPFSPNVIGSTKIIEGNFADCLQTYLTDLEDVRKQTGSVRAGSAVRNWSRTLESGGMPVAYLCGPDRFARDAAARYGAMKAICRAHGLYPVTPFDAVPNIPALHFDDPYATAYNRFERNVQNVINCDLVIANLNDFHGWEPESDTSFECGMAFQLGKKMIGYMDDVTRMRDRVPSLGEAHDYRDLCGCNVENFDYPINLMFSSSMPIVDGDFEQVVEQAVQLLK